MEVLVFGSPHLQQLECDPSEAMTRVRSGLSEFRPDHVVVEWLHPSIDPAQTGNYRPFPDLDSLAAAWNGPGADAGCRHYLKRDMLNAGYQWWLAGSGAELGEVALATLERFEGHELEVLGFAIAREQGLDYITPFDYQGEDAAWNWMDIVMGVGAFAIHAKHGVEEGDSGWEEAFEQYGTSLERYFGAGDSTWLSDYGDLPEVREFAQVVEMWEAERAESARRADLACDYAEIRRLQSAEHAEETRKMYEEVFPTITLDGLGRQLVDNWILRNRRMADFVEQDARRLGRRRILVVVGESHKPFLEDEFRRRGFTVVPATDFLP